MKYKLILLSILFSFTFNASSNERQECRKNLSDNNKIIECIEKNIYDPCDDAGGSHARGLCAWAHVWVAERKIKKSISTMLSLFESWELPDKKKEFLISEEKWKEYRKSYCNSSDALSNYYIKQSTEAILAMDTNNGFCFRRVTEKHAIELEFALSKLLYEPDGF